MMDALVEQSYIQFHLDLNQYIYRNMHHLLLLIYDMLLFFREFQSMRSAAPIVEMVWSKARDLGYGKYFINADGGAITDDHQYVISGRGIPSIDIINYDPDTETGFASYWHTQKDNMDNIDRETLKAVGQTVLEVIYNQ